MKIPHYSQWYAYDNQNMRVFRVLCFIGTPIKEVEFYNGLILPFRYYTYFNIILEYKADMMEQWVRYKIPDINLN